MRLTLKFDTLKGLVLKNLSSALPNFQILSPLDFLAEFTQHIPPKGSHVIRYYGWYSNKARGMHRKAEAAVSAAACSDRIVKSTGQSLQPYLGHADQAGL